MPSPLCLRKKAGVRTWSPAFLIFYQMYSSPVFRSEQTFFSAISAAVSITELTFRADLGQMDTHRIQEMHLSLSVCPGSWTSMAATGHFCAQRPQPLHSFVGFGTMPEPPAFL